MPELNKGDVIAQQHGPFRSMWKVADITEAGAVLDYIPGSVNFTGHGHTLDALNGKPLTSDVNQSFLGRAHWPAAEVLP
jgi:hypothetical protein